LSGPGPLTHDGDALRVGARDRREAAMDDSRTEHGTQPHEDDGGRTAVLVHGAWSNPHDWTWVREGLEQHGVRVLVPDLPSHRLSSAGLTDDAAHVARIAAGSPGPVVLVGWSYGGRVISVAGDRLPTVRRLVYVGDVPADVGAADDVAWMSDDPHFVLRGDGTHVIDGRWWMEEEAGATFSDEVRSVLRAHPRRPASVASWTEPQPAAAWRSVPTTVLLGRDDRVVSDEQWRRARTLPDLRVVDGDHFLLFRSPQAVVDVVLEAFADRV
jgi:pimeloyl-ACP methyl ester carboxylesterase